MRCLYGKHYSRSTDNRDGELEYSGRRFRTHWLTHVITLFHAVLCERLRTPPNRSPFVDDGPMRANYTITHYLIIIMLHGRGCTESIAMCHADVDRLLNNREAYGFLEVQVGDSMNGFLFGDIGFKKMHHM